nr:hypothetical protein [Bathymodiolus platifrons methanotrophic gill symbiont]
MKSGKNAQNIQRYRCKNSACPTQTFMLDCGESLFLRKLVLGIPAQASSKNLTRPLYASGGPDSSSSPRPDPTRGRNIGSK